VIANWLKEAKYIVVFSGAGMSTESGVPDFRSASGLWRNRDPQMLASTFAMEHNREEFVEFYRMRMERLKTVKPHAGYAVLSEWGRQLNLKAVITQNTDGLHEMAGNPNVITLHGTIRRVHCRLCGKTFPNDRYFSGELYCDCGGFLRPSVVLFGESLDAEALSAAGRETGRADLFLVLGSSLTVSPANQFPVMAKQNGARLVIVNRDPTPLDGLADAVVRDRPIGEFLQEVSRQLGIEPPAAGG